MIAEQIACKRELIAYIRRYISIHVRTIVGFAEGNVVGPADGLNEAEVLGLLDGVDVGFPLGDGVGVCEQSRR